MRAVLSLACRRGSRAEGQHDESYDGESEFHEALPFAKPDASNTNVTIEVYKRRRGEGAGARRLVATSRGKVLPPCRATGRSMAALPANPQVEGIDVGEDPQHSFDVLNVEVVAIRLFVRALIE